MPTHEFVYELPRPPAEVFAFLCLPAELARLVPPESALTLLEAPELLHSGSRLTWSARRWGVTQRIVMEVTELRASERLVQTQVEGPFRRWVQTQTLEANGNATCVRETIEFEPPRGMLGRLLTENAIHADLERGHAYRLVQLAQRFEPLP